MTTFEKVRRKIERDMDAIQVHTPESWASILLRHTQTLKDEQEQKKFWAWLGNPEEEDLEAPKLIPMGMPVQTPRNVTVRQKDECDEKCGEVNVDLVNEFEQNGCIMVCRTKPV